MERIEFTMINVETLSRNKIGQKMQVTIPYTYKNIPIPGGGFVTGFIFHSTHKNILYARTDIGGCYRFDFDKKHWISLVDHATEMNSMECFPLSIALDRNNPDALFIACGDGERGLLCKSLDRGNTFRYYEIPSPIHGNHPGRGTGERLVVDDNNSDVIYFGSMKKGLLQSVDGGKTWQQKKVGYHNEMEITFVYLVSSSIVIVGTTGESNQRAANIRGNSLYLSSDSGKSFKPLAEPDPIICENSCIAGFVGQRCTFDGTYLYITAVSTGNYAPYGFSSYACDSNHPADGRLLRYKLAKDGTCEEYVDITPSMIGNGCGLGGVTTNQNVSGLVVCSTIARKAGDMVLLSWDYGLTWEVNLHNLSTGHIDFTVPYMKPEYNGNSSLIHWLSDIKINPQDPNHAVFNTGTGVFMTYNLLEENCSWISETYGIEETVHLNIYSPPSGDVQLIDMLGDLGGFAFTDVNQPAENTFADSEGNRYITCCNGDFSDEKPQHVVATPRGNWTGKTTGGVIYSKDQCKSFKLLSHPFGLTKYIDHLLNEIMKPNTNSGWVAISPDCSTIIWSIAKRIALPANAVVYTTNQGNTWNKAVIMDGDGKELSDDCNGLKVFADRVNSSVFYGFGDQSKIYVSRNGGEIFHQHPTPKDFPIMNLAGIDGGNLSEVRVESGKEGIIWLAMKEGGLWKLEFDKFLDEFQAKRITKENDVVNCQGMGKGIEDQNNRKQCKALYISGIIDGIYGFWQSLDEGVTWNRINHNKQMYGQIRSITGDPRVFGRVYIATGTRGVLYGEPN